MFNETLLQKRALILTSFAHFVNDGVSMVPLSIFPLLLSMFALTPPELGVVAAMWSVTSVIGSPAVGHLSDRLRRDYLLLAAGLAMMATGVIGTGWALATGPTRSWLPLDVYSTLVLSAAIGGFGSSVAHPIGGTLLSQAYPPNKIGRALGLNGATGSLGRAVYPSLVVILITVVNLPSGVVTLGLLGLLPLALMGLFPVTTAQDRVPPISVESPDMPKIRHASTSRVTSWGGSAKASVLVLTIIAMLRGMFGQGVVSFLSVFIVQVQQYPFNFGVGVIMLIAIILGVPGQIMFGHFSDLHRTASLIVNTVGQSVAIILYLNMLSNPFLAATLLALFGFFTYSSYPVFLSAVTDAVPPKFLSLSNSIVWGVGILGGNAIGPLIVGSFVGNNLSLLPTIFLILAIVSGLSTVLVAFLPHRSRQPLPDLKPS